MQAGNGSGYQPNGPVQGYYVSSPWAVLPRGSTWPTRWRIGHRV